MMKYLLIFVAVLIFLLLLLGCENPAAVDLGFQQQQQQQRTTTTIKKTGAGQCVVYVAYEDLGKWFDTHVEIRIDALSAVDKTGHGSTTGFIVVYTPMPTSLPR